MTTHNMPINPTGGPLKGVRGAMLTFTDDPFLCDESQCYKLYSDGLAVIQDGRFVDVGEYSYIEPKYPNLKDIDVHEDALIIPGMIDCHLHPTLNWQLQN